MSFLWKDRDRLMAVREDGSEGSRGRGVGEGGVVRENSSIENLRNLRIFNR